VSLLNRYGLFGLCCPENLVKDLMAGIRQVPNVLHGRKITISWGNICVKVENQDLELII
jgi:hypothetical protein